MRFNSGFKGLIYKQLLKPRGQFFVEGGQNRGQLYNCLISRIKISQLLRTRTTTAIQHYIPMGRHTIKQTKQQLKSLHQQTSHKSIISYTKTSPSSKRTAGNEFVVLLTVHPCKILQIEPIWCTTFFLMCLLHFSTCFGQLCAHHQKLPYLCYTWYLSLYIDKCLVRKSE